MGMMNALGMGTRVAAIAGAASGLAAALKKKKPGTATGALEQPGLMDTLQAKLRAKAGGDTLTTQGEVGSVRRTPGVKPPPPALGAGRSRYLGGA